MVETTQVHINEAEVKQALLNHPEFLINFFLEEKVTVPVPDFHIDMFNLFMQVFYLQVAIAIPRGHSKTTIVKLAIVWLFLFSEYSFIVYCTDTAPVAKDACRDIMDFLSSDNCQAVFEKFQIEKSNESLGITIFYIGEKRCILKSLGGGQQARGLNIGNLRPEVLVCDDAETEEDVETPEARAKFKKWVYGPLFKAMAAQCKKIWIGNLISSNAFLDFLLKDKDWHSVRYGCIKSDGTPLWPDMFPLEKLKADFLAHQRAGMTAKWFAEMMNMPLPGGDQVINIEKIEYRPVRTKADLAYGFITVDPAISEQYRADRTGIAVHGMVGTQWQIVDTFLGKIDPITLFQTCIMFALKWNIRVIGIEAVQFQAALKPFFEYYMMTNNLAGIEVVPLMSGARKSARILGWTSWLKDQTYSLTEGDHAVTQQLLEYDTAKIDNDDDLIDACAYGPQMITEYLNVIIQNFERYRAIETQGALEVCRV